MYSTVKKPVGPLRHYIIAGGSGRSKDAETNPEKCNNNAAGDLGKAIGRTQ